MTNRTLSEVQDDKSIPSGRTSLGSPFNKGMAQSNRPVPSDLDVGLEPWQDMETDSIPLRNGESQNGKGYGNGSTGLKGSPSKL